MAHGSPDSVDQMGDYLRRVMTHRPPTPELIADFQERYRSFGGRSPLLDICRKQAALLQQRLNLPVAVGMRHWHPFIRDAFRELGDANPVVGLPLAPHHSRLSVGAYHAALEAAAREFRPDARIVRIERWHRQPKFVEAWLDRIRAGTELHRPEVVLFTAHSIPRKVVEEGDPYEREVMETVQAIAGRAALPRWSFAWQSASAPRWLEPDVDTVIERLARDGVRRIMAAPIGFVCDHAEVLYDLDRMHRGRARERGVELERCESLNAHPLLVEALADAVREALAA
jgi:ferrochelatase